MTLLKYLLTAPCMHMHSLPPQEGPHSALNEEEFFDALEMAYQNDEMEANVSSFLNLILEGCAYIHKLCMNVHNTYYNFAVMAVIAYPRSV